LKEIYSMRLSVGIALVAFCLSAPVRADVNADTKLVAETLLSDSTLDAVFQTLLPVLSGAMSDQFRTAGVTVSDPSRFTQIFL
jgi:hypothetical protein